MCYQKFTESMVKVNVMLFVFVFRNFKICFYKNVNNKNAVRCKQITHTHTSHVIHNILLEINSFNSTKPQSSRYKYIGI